MFHIVQGMNLKRLAHHRCLGRSELELEPQQVKKYMVSSWPRNDWKRLTICHSPIFIKMANIQDTLVQF